MSAPLDLGPIRERQRSFTSTIGDVDDLIQEVVALRVALKEATVGWRRSIVTLDALRHLPEIQRLSAILPPEAT